MWDLIVSVPDQCLSVYFEVLLFTVPYWRRPLLGCFVCFLRYYQAVTNQLTYDKDPDIRHTSWPKAAELSYLQFRLTNPKAVLNPVRGS